MRNVFLTSCILLIVMVKSQVMKQFSALLATLVACMLFSLSSGAQGKHEINLYMSGACSEYLELNTPRDYTTDLYGLYETQVQYIQSGPGLTLEYNYALLNWLVLGGQFNYHRVIWDQYSRVGGNRANYTNTKNKVALLPQAKFRIPGMKRFRLYAKVAVGMMLNIGHYYTQDPVVFAWDVVPIGCEWGGQRVYGTAELAYGSVIKGGRIGIGFRF